MNDCHTVTHPPDWSQPQHCTILLSPISSDRSLGRSWQPPRNNPPLSCIALSISIISAKLDEGSPLGDLWVSRPQLDVATEMSLSHAVEVLDGVEDTLLLGGVCVWLHVEDEATLEEEVAELGVVLTSESCWGFGITLFGQRWRIGQRWSVGQRWSRGQRRSVLNSLNSQKEA